VSEVPFRLSQSSVRVLWWNKAKAGELRSSKENGYGKESRAALPRLDHGGSGLSFVVLARVKH
jgi:hypothetical protein